MKRILYTTCVLAATMIIAACGAEDGTGDIGDYTTDYVLNITSLSADNATVPSGDNFTVEWTVSTDSPVYNASVYVVDNATWQALGADSLSSLYRAYQANCADNPTTLCDNVGVMTCDWDTLTVGSLICTMSGVTQSTTVTAGDKAVVLRACATDCDYEAVYLTLE